MSNQDKIVNIAANQPRELEEIVSEILDSLQYHENVVTEGLPELSEEMKKHLKDNFYRLKASLLILFSELVTVDDLEKSRDSFTNTYKLLKLIAVSSINLLDAPSPSVQQLDLNQPFEVKTEQSSFRVF